MDARRARMEGLSGEARPVEDEIGRWGCAKTEEPEPRRIVERVEESSVRSLCLGINEVSQLFRAQSTRDVRYWAQRMLVDNELTPPSVIRDNRSPSTLRPFTLHALFPDVRSVPGEPARPSGGKERRKFFVRCRARLEAHGSQEVGELAMEAGVSSRIVRRGLDVGMHFPWMGGLLCLAVVCWLRGDRVTD